jgi:uncharacterized protein
MKNILLISFLLFLLQSGRSQSGSIVVFDHYQDNQIKLSWSFDDYISFESFREYGITVKRQVFSQNGVVLSYQNQLASEVTIVSGLKPRSEAWMTANLTHPKKDVLISLLYDTLDIGIDLNNPKLSDAVMKERADKMRYFTIAFLAGQDFDLNSAAGLALSDDNNVLANHEYRYEFTVTDSMGNHILYPAYHVVNTAESTQYSIPTLHSQPGINSVTLRWTPQENHQYVSYDIYRADAGSDEFQKLNPEPFTYMKMQGDEREAIVFIDSVAAGIEYDYKIQGTTPLGIMSPFSNIVTDMGLAMPIASFPLSHLDPMASETNIEVYWSMPDSFNTYVDHFNIYRSYDQDDNYVKINTDNIPSHSREYIDDSPISEGFYIVEAIATDLNFYRTIPIYAMLIDSTPPLPPIGLTARYFGHSKVELSWTPNEEDDLYGYRVMMSDSRDGNYAQITQEAITANEYTTYTNPDDPRDSTFFKVFAVDKRGNYSDLSEPFGLKKPNTVPPAKPNLKVVKSDKKGIKLKWAYSSSDDVAAHKLERKMEGASQWVEVLSIDEEAKSAYMPSDSADYNYIDEDILEQRPYQYRLVAVNDQYVNASSDIMTVTPMKPTFSSSNITNFALEEEVVASFTSTEVLLQLSKLKREKPSAAKNFSNGNKPIRNIVLSWSYPLDPTVQDFQIYRSITGGTTTLYRTVSITESMGYDPNTEELIIEEDMGVVDLSIKDKDLLAGRRYTYQVMARHKDQSTSKLSNSLTLKLEHL